MNVSKICSNLENNASLCLTLDEKILFKRYWGWFSVLCKVTKRDISDDGATSGVSTFEVLKRKRKYKLLF